MTYLFDIRPERSGYRLHCLEVFNWGTFDSSDGGVFRFEPEGRTSLLVGHNGSGKSTLVDAILTLLVDSRTRNYNVAAGAKKSERTPKSYIKGAYDRTSDQSHASVVKYLRPDGNHLTAISAVFRDEQLDRAFTLTQVLHLKSDGSDDKVYAIADEARELQQVLSGLKKSDAVREHLKECGYQTTRAYVEYQGWLAKRTKMRGKAIDMFNQTVAVKDIQSLNAFIRKHMLEGSDWRDKVGRLLSHFNDLSVAHQQLVRSRRSLELLTPVETIGQKHRRQAEKLHGLELQLDAARTYFPTMLIQLFEPELDRQQQNETAAAGVIERLDESLIETRETIRKLKNEIDAAAGQRLRQIPDLLRLEEAHRTHKEAAAKRYLESLKVCGIDLAQIDAAAFENTRSALREMSESFSGKLAAAKSRYEEAIAQKTIVDSALRDERRELAALARRRTNLPARLAAIRTQVCGALDIEESALPFAAELISVRPEQRRWESSIEMVLRSFGLSMLVPERYYTRVGSFLESHRIEDSLGEGGRLDYMCVGKTKRRSDDRVDAHSLVSKLKFKPEHPLSPWVREELERRFACRCCETLEELHDAPRMALTANRHVKFNAVNHKKDDRQRVADPRHFVLGWENAEKKGRIAEQIRQFEASQSDLIASIDALVAEREQIEEIIQAASAASRVADFDEIDAERHRREIAALTEERNHLEQGSDTSQLLRERLRHAETAELEQSRQRDRRLQERAKLESAIERVRRMVKAAAAEVEANRRAGELERHQQVFASITQSLEADPLTIENFASRRRSWERSATAQIADLREPLATLGDRLGAAMLAYLREFKEETDDLDASVRSLDSFMAILHRVREEDLPRYEKKFKDRLNDQVTQEVALFNAELNRERRQIEDKIAQLNEALACVDYSPGTFMRLEPRLVVDGEIEEFRQSLRQCLDEKLELSDQSNELRFQRIRNLVERLSDNDRATWRTRVVDVRNWYDFAAQEIDAESGAMRSCYDGSSGQSGGEKAKLAFTILVAALAYQFDVDPSGNTHGRFQFVVVDEMFSKVDDQNAQYALKLFQQFGLQLLIVAPLDAKARVTESFVDRYLHVVKDPETNHSQIYSMTAREYGEVVRQISSAPTAKSPLTAS